MIVWVEVEKGGGGMIPCKKLLITVTFILCSVLTCTGNEAERVKKVSTKGVNPDMTNYFIGRFSIKVPASLLQTARSHRLRLAEIQEFDWADRDSRGEIRDELWREKVAEIKNKRPPSHKSDPVIESREFDKLGNWAKGIFYYGNYALAQEGKWEILIDYGPTGIWLKTDSILTDADNVNKMVRNLTDIAKAYIPGKVAGEKTMGNVFHLNNGIIDLPYRWDERSFVRFEEAPVGQKLEIEMKETHIDEPKHEGLLARVAAAIVTGYASGVDTDRIRSRNRTVAGLDGEEQVVRMSDKDGTELSFIWRYAGKKDSGENPKITISMDSPDGKLVEKLKVWDAILDSMRPLYRK
jgi:hypothetical protein